MNDARLYDGVTQGRLRCRAVRADHIEVIVTTADGQPSGVWDVFMPRGERRWVVDTPGGPGITDPVRHGEKCNDWMERLPRFERVSAALNHIEKRIDG